jgi:hypothetical protein
VKEKLEIPDNRQRKGERERWVEVHHSAQRRLNTKRPTIVFFWAPQNLSHHIDSQARTGNIYTVLVKNREMTRRTRKLLWWLRGRRRKDDRKKYIGAVDSAYRESAEQGNCRYRHYWLDYIACLSQRELEIASYSW